MRSIMAEHTLLIDVIDRVKRILNSTHNEHNKRVREVADEFELLEGIILINNKLREDGVYLKNFALKKSWKYIHKSIDKMNRSRTDIMTDDEAIQRLARVIEKLAYPVAVMPKRNIPRMLAQQGCFTIHGGKRMEPTLHPIINEIYDKVSRLSRKTNIEDRERKILKQINKIESHFKLFRPVSLDTLNRIVPKNKKFLIHFYIDVNAREKILNELEGLSINSAALFPELDNQAAYVEKRWTYHKKKKK